MKQALLAAVTALLALPGPAAAASGDALLQLPAADACRYGPALASAGAETVAPELGVWRLPAARARALAAELRRAGAAVRVRADRTVGRLEVVQPTDPLVPELWWRSAVRADQIELPGPGRPLTIVDSGLDVQHEEFAARPDTLVLNEQTPGGGGTHGTSVASIAAAPANGVGMVGIYPQAALAVWDAAPTRELVTSEIVAGITTAARSGAGVVNLSFGGRVRDPLIEQAVNFALSRGVLVVAAAGNSRDEGSPREFPATLPHVLTVAATDQADAVAPFSSASPFVDLAAPGVDMLAAVPLSLDASGYRYASGTSFSAPLVAGAAALVWTVRPELDASQLFEVLRRSARDVGAPGRDPDTGFGVLDVAAALAHPAPTRDPFEPNEDVDEVRPDGFFSVGAQPLTTPRRPRTTVAARLDAVEDPRDVYRVWLPARTRLTATVAADADVGLSAWKGDSATVLADARSQRLALAARPRATSERVQVANAARRGRYVYLDVDLARGTPAAGYRLRITTAALPAPQKKR